MCHQGEGGGVLSSNFVHQMCHQGGGGRRGGGGGEEGGPKPDFVHNFGRLYLLNWMRHCFQIFTVCRPHKGLPVCWILKPSVIYVRSYGHLWYFHWSSRNFKNISLWAFRFGIQIVLGVPYNILKFEADMINTLGEIDIQNFSIFTPPPPVDRRTETLKT